VSTLTQLELEQLMLTTLRAEPNILGVAVGFEPVRPLLVYVVRFLSLGVAT
jgi:hypothetical protein